MVLERGDFVQLHGLKSAKQYNGIVALVIENATSEGRYPVQLLDHQEEWRECEPKSSLECAGKIIAAKAANLVPSEDSKHWKLEAAEGLSIREMITKYKPLRQMEDCEVFCKTIWDQFFESIPSLPLDQDAFQHICSNDVSGHKIYWLRCDAIMHHMIIEKSRGRYRIFQAYIGEYTGGEWCDMKTLDTKPWLNKNSFWKQFGGGRTVGMDDIRIPFDSIHQIQKLIPALTPYLLQHIPGITKQDLKDIEGIKSRNLKVERMKDQIVRISDICQRWSNQILSRIGTLGITALGVNEARGELFYQYGDQTVIEIVQGNLTLFEIPFKLYSKLQKANYNLTGQVYLHTVIFVKLVNQGLLWEYVRNAEGGTHGFGYQPASLDMQQSYEEGLSNAENMRRIVKDRSKMMCIDK